MKNLISAFFFPRFSFRVFEFFIGLYSKARKRKRGNSLSKSRLPGSSVTQENRRSLCLLIPFYLVLSKDYIFRDFRDFRVFDLANPKGVAILTQPGIGLSKLNSHKFDHNFRDTVDPMCLINDGMEDTEKLLLQCYAYESQRRDLLGTVNEVF